MENVKGIGKCCRACVQLHRAAAGVPPAIARKRKAKPAGAGAGTGDGDACTAATHAPAIESDTLQPHLPFMHLASAPSLMLTRSRARESPPAAAPLLAVAEALAGLGGPPTVSSMHSTKRMRVDPPVIELRFTRWGQRLVQAIEKTRCGGLTPEHALTLTLPEVECGHIAAWDVSQMRNAGGAQSLIFTASLPLGAAVHEAMRPPLLIAKMFLRPEEWMREVSVFKMLSREQADAVMLGKHVRHMWQASDLVKLLAGGLPELLTNAAILFCEFDRARPSKAHSHEPAQPSKIVQTERLGIQQLCFFRRYAGSMHNLVQSGSSEAAFHSQHRLQLRQRLFAAATHGERALRSCRFIRHCAAGLQFLHGQSLLLGDIKPANLFYDEGAIGEPVFGDFGLSAMKGLHAGARGSLQLAVPASPEEQDCPIRYQRHTRDPACEEGVRMRTLRDFGKEEPGRSSVGLGLLGTSYGTSGFRAPETIVVRGRDGAVLPGFSLYGGFSDCYSLAVTLLQILVGERVQPAPVKIVYTRKGGGQVHEVQEDGRYGDSDAATLDGFMEEQYRALAEGRLEKEWDKSFAGPSGWKSEAPFLATVPRSVREVLSRMLAWDIAKRATVADLLGACDAEMSGE